MPEGEPARGAGRDVQPGPVVIWRLSDGKAGHDNQSLGLAEALASEVACEIHPLTPLGAAAALICLATGRTPAYGSHPNPHLILGAGHATHLSLLAARRAMGGRVVVLMTPSLPKRLFDLCLIPEHDTPLAADNVILTRGALNRVRPCASKDASSGLILIGGPSAHFDLDQPKLLAQIRTVLEKDPGVFWTATTSRRTPPQLIASLNRIKAANFELVTVDETSPGWLAERLARTARVWVTEDSASMVYEALSSGAAVGLLTLKTTRPGRISRGIERLIKEHRVTRFEQWVDGEALAEPDAPLNEAKRCARLILDRWPELARR
ncbi:MAG TPA: mitochondrial fission ELM1 family protein [Gammaproteobacteria bacterium]|nr:mitochondrial fission ELM1 family protein [Gammaproteobacteria bacterium]